MNNNGTDIQPSYNNKGNLIKYIDGKEYHLSDKIINALHIENVISYVFIEDVTGNKDERLNIIVKDYPYVWDDLKVLKGLLSDYYPEEKLLRNLIYTCAVEKIPQSIIKKKSVDRIDYYKYEKKIIESHGCSSETAHEVITKLEYALENAN